MGRFSIRLKITIWFTAALVVIVLFAYLMIFVVSRQILIKTIQDSLVETVENNVDEIEYFSGMDEIRTDADIDYLIDYRKGYLEIDDDFLSKVNEVYTGLYEVKAYLWRKSNSCTSGRSGICGFRDSKSNEGWNGVLYF